MMSQLTLAAVVVAVLAGADGAALAPPLAVGHGAPDAELAGVAVVVVVAAVVGVAVPEAAVVGDAVLPAPWWWPWPAVLAGLAGITYAAGETQLAFAASAALRPEWSTTATIAPTATTSATGMPTGPARRASGPLDRRPADRRLLGI
jgi:hypothetical protein